MALNSVPLNPGVGGHDIQTDLIAGKDVEVIKQAFGTEGTLTLVDAAHPLPVTDADQQTDALTDIELRATPVPISGTVTANTGLTQPLTDVQLRATPVPISGTVTVDTSTLATSAKQDTGNTSLASILAKIIAAPATEAKQDTIITALNSIDAGTAAALGQALMAASVPVVISSNQSAVPISGTVTVDTSLLATQATLALIKAKTDNIPALGQALAAASVPVTLTAAEETILNALLTITDFDTKTGSLTETAPATDTASSGLNGRLQRVAQRLTSLIALLPAALGAGGGLKVDGSGTALPISGSISNTSFASTIADGADVTLGALADAIVAAGATGSISAKLRRATQGLEDLKTLIVLAAGTALIGKVGIDQTTDGTTNKVSATQATASNLNAQTVGNVAHDAADSGNPIKVGAKAISSLATTTLVSSADRTDNQSDLDGALLVRIGHPLGDSISERVTNTDGASTAFTNFAAVASTKNCINAIVVINSSPTFCTVDFRDGTGGAVLWTLPIPASGGAVLAKGSTPYFKTSANTALAYDVSAATTTVTISVSGFQSKI